MHSNWTTNNTTAPANLMQKDREAFFFQLCARFKSKSTFWWLNFGSVRLCFPCFDNTKKWPKRSSCFPPLPNRVINFQYARLSQLAIYFRIKIQYGYERIRHKQNGVRGREDISKILCLVRSFHKPNIGIQKKSYKTWRTQKLSRLSAISYRRRTVGRMHLHM